MIKSRLLRVMGKSQNLEVLREIIWHYFGLLAQIVLVGSIAVLISDFYYDILTTNNVILYVGIVTLSIMARLIFIKLYFDAKAQASRDATVIIREEIFNKTLRLGNSFETSTTTMHVSEMLTEGADLIEAYYSEFLDSVGYAALGTVTMIGLLFFIDPAATIIILIAIIIAVVAFVIINKGETFISIKYIILILECVSYIGAVIGLATSIKNLARGQLELQWAIILFYLCLEVFQPLIEIGKELPDSIVALRGVDEILDFLYAREPKEGKAELEGEGIKMVLNEVSYKYNGNSVLESVSLMIPAGGIIGITGEPGCGKSTLAGILSKKNREYKGSVKVNGKELSNLSQDLILDKVTYISDKSHIFAKTIRENLLMANPKASEKRMINSLMVVNLWGSIKEKGGLNYSLEENKLTPGEKMKLAFARALIKNSKMYIFDNVTKGVDEESKEILVKLIHQLAKDMGRTVVFFSENVEDLSDINKVYVLADGVVDEYGKGTKAN